MQHWISVAATKWHMVVPARLFVGVTPSTSQKIEGLEQHLKPRIVGAQLTTTPSQPCCMSLDVTSSISRETKGLEQHLKPRIVGAQLTTTPSQPCCVSLDVANGSLLRGHQRSDGGFEIGGEELVRCLVLIRARAPEMSQCRI